jgi:hypothetical protein
VALEKDGKCDGCLRLVNTIAINTEDPAGIGPPPSFTLPNELRHLGGTSVEKVGSDFIVEKQGYLLDTIRFRGKGENLYRL